jgi:hypothetical protein
MVMTATAPWRIGETGAPGKAGRARVAHLRGQGNDVLAGDAAVSHARVAGSHTDNLAGYAEAARVLRGAGAVVPLAGIPASGLPAVREITGRGAPLATGRARQLTGRGPARSWHGEIPAQ